jgi:transposase
LEPVWETDYSFLLVPQNVAPKGSTQGRIIGYRKLRRNITTIGVQKMEVIYERCCGMDVHKDEIVACLISGRRKEVKSFSTITESLLGLVDWLKSEGCQHVAMESTGPYWKPIYNLLETEEMPTMVVNAQHIKAVPGRKTDVKDSEWIADLLRHGLLKGSLIPSREQRELKELVRYRRSIIEERARELNRIQKVLEGANIKLASIVSNIDGVSSREMLNALVSGSTDVKAMSAMGRGALKKKSDMLEKALTGLMGNHQRMILAEMLRHIDSLEESIKRLDKEVDQRMLPFKEEVALLDEISGVGERNAQTIIAEIGVDMSVFPTEAHLASWAGMCPGNNESAGKKKSGKTRKGSKTLRSCLVESAKAVGRKKTCYLSSQYRSIAARRGVNRAAVAVGHSILVICYHILKNKVHYKDLGIDYLEKNKRKHIAKSAVKRLEALGYKVTIEDTAA